MKALRDAQMAMLQGPLHIDRNVAIAGAQFHLRSVVIHAGASLHEGHYWSVVRHGQPENEQWWRYNDAERMPATEHDVDNPRSGGNVYVVMYERQPQ